MTTTTTTSSTTGSISATLGVGSGLDTTTLVANLVAASRQAKDAALTAQSTKVTSQISGLSALKSAVTVFSSSLSQLVAGGTLSTQPVSSDSSVVDATAITGQTIGAVSSSLTVQQLATSQSIAGPVIADADTAIGTGQLTFTFGDATVTAGSMTGFTAKATPAALSLAIDGSNNTLNGIAAAINSKNAGLTATVVTDSAGARLVIKGASGTDAAFTIGATEDAGAPGLSQLAFGPGQGTTTLTQAAQNALVTYDGLTVSRPSNSITDLVPGVKLAIKAVSASAVTIEGERPTAAITDAMTNFVNAYNSLQATIADETDKDSGPLNGDSSVRQMQSMLGKLTSTALRASGHPATLAEIGVSTNRDGTLSLDTAKLAAAQASHPDEIEAMFNPTQTSSSALVRITSAAGAAAAGTHTATNIVPATAGTQTGTASPNAFTAPLVLDGTNNVFHVAIDGRSSVDVTVAAGSYADGTSFAAAFNDAMNAASLKASVTWNVSAGTLGAQSRTFGSLSTITLSAEDGNVNDLLGLSGAATARGTSASGMIDGVAAVSVGNLLYASSTGTAKGLILQPLAGATSATISIDQGLGTALSSIVDGLTGTSGALYTANEQLTKQQTDIAAQQTSVNDKADALKTQLTQSFSAMDAKVAAYKSTQAFLTQQIDAWNKSS